MTQQARMKAFAAAILVVAFSLVGCTTAQEDVNDGSKNEVDINLEDGSSVHCIFMTSKVGGLSCDWVEYHQRTDHRPPAAP